MGRRPLITATLLALAAAVLHAGWNLAIKVSGDRFVAAWGQFVAGALVFAPLLALTGLPSHRALPMLAASSIIHCAYLSALVRAYGTGDFSLAYPLARGGGALLAGLGGALFLDDELGALAWVGVAVVAIGLASTVRPTTSRVALGWAGLTAVTIGAYTLIDAVGSRRSSSGLAYGFTLFITAGAAMTVVGVVSGRGPAFVAALPRSWWRFVLTGAASNLAYALVLVAVRRAPVGYVATLRESSVVLGALAGWWLLHERLARARVVSAMVVVCGMALLIAGR